MPAKKDYVNPAQEMANAMIAEIELAISEDRELPWKKSWIGGSGMPSQIVTGKPYRGINALILWLCGQGETRFATSSTMTKIGGKFKNWEDGKTKALPIVFFKNGKSKTKKKKDGSAASFAFLKRYKVYPLSCFDLSEVDPKMLPVIEIVGDLAQVDPIDSAQAIIDGYKLGPSISFGGSRACYSSLTDSVSLPEMADFISSESFYSVAFHELGHSTGHADRLNRPELVGGATFGDHRYSQEELCAEFTSAMLCQRAGITTKETHENSIAYLRGWLKALKDSPEMLVRAGWAAQKAADHICGTTLDPMVASA